MSINVQDVVTRIEDWAGSYSVGQSTLEQKVRAVDFATNILFQRLGYNQGIYTFKYFQDTVFYDLPSTFKEYIALSYHDVNDNTPVNTWAYRPYQEISRITGSGFGNFAGITSANTGSKQLAMIGTNLTQGATLDSFDDTLWTASEDASAIAFDYNIKVQGSASQKFTITQSLSEAIISRIVDYDFTNLHTMGGALKIYTFLPSVDLLYIKIKYGTDSSNYYTINVTENADGSAWTVNDWNLLGFMTDDKVTIGSPDETNITFVQVIYALDAGFGTVTSFRLDWLYTSFPDELDLLHYTTIKGTDSTGANITKVTDTTDNINLDDDFIEPLALKATLYVFPQLRGDVNFMQLYQSDYTDMLKLFGRSRPRIRNQNDYSSARLRK